MSGAPDFDLSDSKADAGRSAGVVRYITRDIPDVFVAFLDKLDLLVSD